MKHFPYYILCCLLVLSSCGQRGEGRCEEETSCGDSVFVRYEYGIPIDSFRVDTGYVREGETLGGILKRCGATDRQMSGVLTLDKAQFDVRQIRAGKRYLALYQPDSVLCYWVYQPDIRTAKVLHLTDSLHVEHFEKSIQLVERRAQATIESSLWNAMVENDLPVDLALELSEIYAWTIDFFGLQKGDSVRVYYEEQFVDSTRIGIGSIYAAHFYHGRRWQEAYWYENEDISGYFDEQGNSLRKAFLKAPLNYKRISSRFTYARKHPIYKIVRPHTGVDYAAPAGTPVVSIGDGTVVEKGYKGGGGHTVKIRHNSTYTTAYLHLSKYAKDLRVGNRVKQGEVIGYVGSSGSSTGPHLDFRVWKNGTPIDPLKMESPPVAPVPAKYQAAFDSTTLVLKEKLYNL
ncbi:MAG: M23 family metallopeptidase [Paludibacteraceae bacterium]